MTNDEAYAKEERDIETEGRAFFQELTEMDSTDSYIEYMEMVDPRIYDDEQEMREDCTLAYQSDGPSGVRIIKSTVCPNHVWLVSF
ncbi:MAG: hypothetical protein GY938_13200 [Ketobacter sp.]|nr:hypothetical protein [Ketobacter sp.]